MIDNFYKNLIQEADIGYSYHKIICDDDGIPFDYEFVEANKAFEKYTGLCVSEIIGKRITEIIPEITSDEFDWVKFYGEIALGGGEETFEQYSKILNKWYRIKAFSIEKYYFATMFTDISEEKIRSFELEKIEERYRYIIEGSNEGTWELNDQTGEQKVNKRWAEMLGYTLEELSPINYNTWINLCHPEDNIKARQFIDKVFMEKGGNFEVEFRMRHKDGHWLWISSKGKANTWTEDGKPLITSGTHTDITERKLAEEKLYQSEEKFKLLFEQAPLGYQSLDYEGNILEVNDKWLEIFGYAREEVIGKWLGEFVSPSFHEYLKNQFIIFKEKGSVHSELEMISKKGEILNINFDGKIGIDPEGNFVQTHSILKDITLEKKLENELGYTRRLIHSILENTTDPIYVKNLNGKYLIFNKAAEKFTNKNAKDVIGKDDYFLFKPETAKNIIDLDKKILANEITRAFEDFYDESGEHKYMITTKGPVYDEKNKLAGIFGIVHDISEIKQIELALEKEKKLIEATLISVGDGVISCDKDGRVIFLNPIAEKLTGWKQEDAKGQEIEKVFNIISEKTGKKSEDIAKKVLESGVINELSNHTLLVSRDGTKRPIEDSAAPIIQENGQIVGVVIAFKDCTEKNERLNEIKYLSYHDHLTGLYNRRFFEEEMKRSDTSRNYPLTIVMADINGLKLINDSFGHSMGDKLLKKAAEVISKSLRSDDIVARLGGDEFVFILPKTGAIEAEKLIRRIRKDMSGFKIGSVVLSISFGFDTKRRDSENLNDILKNAEDHMYRHKLYESASMRSKTINLIINTLYEKNVREMNHSKRVGRICELIAMGLGYKSDDVNQIRIAGLMHDIGKIGIEDNILNKAGNLDEQEWLMIKKHSEIGYRILSSVNEFSEIAEYVLEHQEKWDGSGYPRGLVGEQISKQARIIAVADAFDAMTGERTYGRTLSQKEAIEELKRCSNTHFDPEIVKVFVDIILNEK